MSTPNMKMPATAGNRSNTLPSRNLRDRLRMLAISLPVLAAGLFIATQVMAAGPGSKAYPRAMDIVDTAGTCPALLNVDFLRLQDDTRQNLCQYAGKVLLVVNTASYCGYTKQYEGLEKIYAQYRNRGLVVLAFPSNDFGQESSDTGKIADLCFNTYGVKFPIFKQTVVTGAKANPLFGTLIKATGQQPAWNFHKYLVDRSGRPVAAFPSNIDPEDPRLTREIERLLNRPTT